MRLRKVAIGATGLSVVVAAAWIGGVGAAGAAGTVPSRVVVKEKQTLRIKPNRYLQDGLRFDRDVYTVKSGGTVVFRITAPREGPHTLSVVAAKDVPRTARQVFNCKVCNKLGKAHGADPNSNAPPKFRFLENGVADVRARERIGMRGHVVVRTVRRFRRASFWKHRLHRIRRRKCGKGDRALYHLRAAIGRGFALPGAA